MGAGAGIGVRTGRRVDGRESPGYYCTRILEYQVIVEVEVGRAREREREGDANYSY